ncbi:MAG: hypothetical protein WCI18_03130 [Pseudomonadota bacterium]
MVKIIGILLVSLTAAVTYGSEFEYNRYRSPAALGRGDTGIASSRDEDAPFYNPALIGFGTGIYKKLILGSIGLDLSMATRDAIREISLQESDSIDTLRKSIGVPQHIGAHVLGPSLILRRAAISTYLTSSNQAMIFKSASSRGLESVAIDSVTSAGLAFTVAQDFAKDHSVGMTARYETKNQVDVEVNATDGENLKGLSGDDAGRYVMAGRGIPIDLGYAFKLGDKMNTSLGLTVKDALATAYIPSKATTLKKEDRALKDGKRTINAGFAFEPGTKDSKMRVLGDWLDITNAYGSPTFKRVHLGSEISLKDFIGFSAGLNQGYPTFGIFADIRILRMDFGRYTEEVGSKVGERPDTRFFLRLSAGF